MPGPKGDMTLETVWDAPSAYLHNKHVFYHASADAADVVPASGLRSAVQAFAKILDDVHKLDVKALAPVAVP